MKSLSNFITVTFHELFNDSIINDRSEVEPSEG